MLFSLAAGRYNHLTYCGIQVLILVEYKISFGTLEIQSLWNTNFFFGRWENYSSPSLWNTKFFISQLEDLLAPFCFFAGWKSEPSSLVCGIQVFLGLFDFFWGGVFLLGVAPWKDLIIILGLEYKIYCSCSFVEYKIFGGFWCLEEIIIILDLEYKISSSFVEYKFFWWFLWCFEDLIILLGLWNTKFLILHLWNTKSLGGGLFGAWKISLSSLVWNIKFIVLCGIQGNFFLFLFFGAWEDFIILGLEYKIYIRSLGGVCLVLGRYHRPWFVEYNSFVEYKFSGLFFGGFFFFLVCLFVVFFFLWCLEDILLGLWNTIHLWNTSSLGCFLVGFFFLVHLFG
ncbi:uncharacterized protein LOC110196525 [Phascolarctos cinereus]|uniref:Uncharacterized protein LOC110196526 n=1 Tax=Phascolarctos cinereus TaxID=38626 RepID=A0A6P5J3H9_PHACI|nr:uncharacterized protein LOC110196526 [Phascolarctos cinereus]